MNNVSITRILTGHKTTQNIFKGVFPSDQIPLSRPKFKPVCYVANIDPARFAGSHWVALYLTPEGENEYFDSYGLPPILPRFLKLLRFDYRYNATQLQSLKSTVCGQYCVFYVWRKSLGESLERIINYFTDERHENDLIVNQIVEDEFNVDLDVVSPDFIYSQMASTLHRFQLHLNLAGLRRY